MGEKFELKYLIRLVFWRKKPHIVTDIGGGFFRFLRRCRGVGVSHRRLCVFLGGGRVFRVSERPERGL